MTNSERASYIRGLMDGLDLNAEAKETKVLNAVVDLLEGLCQSMDELEDDVAEMAEQVDEIDEDLGTLEEDFYGLEEDEECGCGCHHHHHDEEEWDDDEWDDEEDEDLTDLYDEENPLYEITCPNCGEVVCMDEDMLFSPDCACPNCGTSFEIELDEEDCDCEECAEEDKE